MISLNYTIPTATVSVLTSTYANLKKNGYKVIERSHGVTPRSKYKTSKGHPRSSCAPNMVQFRLLFPELQHLKKVVHAIFLWLAAILKVSVKPNQFSNLA